MTLEQNPESAMPQAPIGPPDGPASGAKAIFWNEREFRAGWRLLIYFLFVVLFTLAGTFLTTALHLPQITGGDLTATSTLVHDGIGVIAIFAAAAVMGMLEARPFGGYGLPRAAAFGARFWRGRGVKGIAMIAANIFLIRVLGGYSFGDLALRGSAIWGYAALWAAAFLFVGFFEEFLFAATLSSLWPRASDSGRRPRRFPWHSARCICATAAKTKLGRSACLRSPCFSA